MKTDEQLIAEIKEHVRESFYPGSSFYCGVRPVTFVEDFSCEYYDAESCVLATEIKTGKEKLIRDIYTLEQAKRLYGTHDKLVELFNAKD